MSPEDRALTSLDRHFDVFDNPGGGGTDGKVSTGDLKDIAGGDFNRDVARQRLEASGVAPDQVDGVLKEMVSEGMLCRNEYERMVIPTYYRTLEEYRAPFSGGTIGPDLAIEECSLAILSDPFYDAYRED